VDLPSGVVTFVMTDIEGSTRLWEEAPEAMRAALARHDAIAASVVAEHAGFLIKPRGEGDSTFSVFARATDAVLAVCELQQALSSEPWPEGAPLRVRVAVHTGEADLGEDDYYGAAVNRCARLRSIAHGGQVLVSESTTGLVREALPEEVALRDLGHQRLRDLAEPERVSQLLHAALPSDFPALRTIDSIPNNLPYQVSAFIGREEEMAAIKRLLRETRLLTLTGAGGVGKTRLALQAAAEMLYEYPDGVWLVELAALSDGGLAWQVLAAAAGVQEERGRPVEETTLAHLGRGSALVLLDNCEHLVDACAAVAERIARCCPGVRVLATSREALRAEGETVWRVPSLSAPHPQLGLALQPQHLTQYASVRLFVDRAAKARSGFCITGETAPAVAEICARLDGVPLAIELAAARARTLSPPQIEQRLSERFQLLTGGRRTALPRQQTLEATVAWSYDLLTEAEKALFVRLSVFTGGFTLESAEAVCSGAATAGCGVADLVDGLVAKSLVIPGDERYWTLETLKAYGAERLNESGAGAAARRLHAAHFLRLADRGQATVRGRERAEWLDRMAAEHGNIRSALAWATASDPETAGRLALATTLFWLIRGHWTEGCEVLAGVLSLEGLPAALRIRILDTAGDLRRNRGECAAAQRLHEEALALSRGAADRRGEANALNSLGNVAHNRGDLPAARAMYEEAREIRQELGDEPGMASVSHNLGLVALATGDHQAARLHFRASIEVHRRGGDTHRLAASLQALGNVEARVGDWDRARSTHEEALCLLRELGDQVAVAHSYHNLGWVAHEQGDYDSARRLYGEALAIYREGGAKRFAANTLNNLGNVEREVGHTADARELLTESVALQRQVGDALGLATSLVCLGQVALATRDLDEAAQLVSEAVDSQRAHGDRHGEGMSRVVLGAVAFVSGDLKGAREHLSLGARLAAESGERPQLPAVLETLGRIAFAEGEPSRAARCLAAAEAGRSALGMRIEPSGVAEHDQAVSEIGAALGEDAFAAAWAEGEAMTLDEAIAFALEDEPDA
jgi:predicted ATPase/class 3 adenylate cyclase